MAKKTKPAVSVLLLLLLLFCAAFRLGCLPAGSLVAASSLSSLQPPLKSQLIENENVCTKSKVILVVGSANVDTFLPVSRLPSEGENLTTQRPPIVDVPGGKGCTQAVAASKLVMESSCSDECVVRFVGQLGMEDEKAAQVLSDTLDQHHIDYSHCGFHKDLPSGRGYVFWTQSGSVSAVVSGGSNQYGWSRWKDAWENPDNSNIEQELDQILSGVKCIMLQREVPEYVNLLIASRAKQIDPTIVVIQDIGGEDRPISKQMLDLCDYVVPNESELMRLVRSSCDVHHLDESHLRQSSGCDILEYARALQRIGASNILVTQGSRGSFLVDKDGQIHNQKAIPVPSSATVIDETGAGDCFRAAFCVALMEGHDPSQCMLFASSAGSCSVEVNGAVPSTPSRSRVLDRMADGVVLDIPRGDGQQQSSEANGGTKHSDNVEVGETENLQDNHPGKKENRFPFLFGSRLNSMKDRPDLWEGKPLENPKDYVERQASVEGLTCVDFNYPQHFTATHWTSAEAKATLQKAGLVAGAVCLRYPSSFARGAMNHPSLSMRKEAIKLTKEAAEVAMELGTNEVVIWSAFDGYDYPFQVEYGEKWDQLVSTFQELCDEYPSIKFSLEFKPTDENTRFFTVPTTGAALLFVEEVNRPNMGLTLDIGHMLMAGENPGQSIAMVGRRKKLFGIQLNDGFTRLAAEDGLMFGSVHPSMALEIMYQLRMTNFCGHIYFDTFPQRSDPVKEAEYNILQAKRFWNAACSIDPSELKRITDEHDAIGALNMINRVLWAR